MVSYSFTYRFYSITHAAILAFVTGLSINISRTLVKISLTTWRKLLLRQRLLQNVSAYGKIRRY